MQVGTKKADLSILICSITERAGMLAALRAQLERQIRKVAPRPIEVLVIADDGDLSIGAKRQLLLDTANGEYVAFVDDDDRVSDDYIKSILAAMESKPDVVGMKGMYYENGEARKPFIHSMGVMTWYETEAAYWRCPNHLNPVKRTIARSVGFKDRNHGEDKEYSERLRARLTTEVMVEPIIYHYLHSSVGSRSHGVKRV